MGYTIKDRVLLGWIAGALGVITRDLWSLLSKWLGLTHLYFWEISADLFITGKATHTFLAHTVGIVADLIFGGILGIVFIYVLKFISHKNIIIKGWGTGLVAWLLLFGFMLHYLPSIDIAPKDALSNFSAFIGHSIFGISMGIYAKLLFAKFHISMNGGR